MSHAYTENLRRSFSLFSIRSSDDNEAEKIIKKKTNVNCPMEIDTLSNTDVSCNTPVKTKERRQNIFTNRSDSNCYANASKESLSTIEATPVYDKDTPTQSRFNLQTCATINRGIGHGHSLTENSLSPQRLLSYVQVSFNLVLLLVLIWGVGTFVKAIRDDIDSKIQIHSMELMDKVSACAREYRENRCDPKERVPALEKVCNEWETCMNEDSAIIAKRSKLSAQTIGEVVNAFLEQLTWKSFSLLAASFFTIFIGSNCALSMAYNTRCRY